MRQTGTSVPLLEVDGRIDPATEHMADGLPVNVCPCSVKQPLISSIDAGITGVDGFEHARVPGTASRGLCTL